MWEDPGSNLTAAVVFITTTTAIYSLGHGLCTFTAVPRSTQPSTLRGMVKWVSAFGLSNNKMAMVDVDDSIYRQTHSPSRLAWSEGWQPPGAQSAFIKWTGWTLAMALRHDDSTINIVIELLLLLLVILNKIIWSLSYSITCSSHSLSSGPSAPLPYLTYSACAV